MFRRVSAIPLILAVSLAGAGAAQAESELSFYLGVQDSPHSRIEGDDPGGAGEVDRLVDWEGKSFEAPPYYGFRYTWWRNDRLGFGVDFNHAKVYADDASREAAGFSRLELTDGLNILTANVFRRWQSETTRWTPYVGAGLGVAVPHVDVESDGRKTFEYQLTGPAAQVVAGVSYEVNDSWSVFGEYKGTYSSHELELDSGGSLDTDIVTNALNLGVSFGF